MATKNGLDIQHVPYKGSTPAYRIWQVGESAS